MKTADIFETTNVDLAAFLMLEGVKFLECKNSSGLRDVVVMRFLDEKKNSRDLERVFMSSEFKTYRDLTKYLLKEIHNKKRESK